MKRDRIIGLINNLAVRRVSRKISILLFIILFVSLGNVNTLKLGAEESEPTLDEALQAVLADSVENLEAKGWNVHTIDEGDVDQETIDEYTPSFPANSILYTRIPAAESTEDSDVCIYVTNEGSGTYMENVNAERATWGLNPVSYSKDLEEGAMLRAGEWLESKYRGQEYGPHETYEYPATTYENTDATFGSLMPNYMPEFSFNDWMGEKQLLPAGYTPQDDGWTGGSAGHYMAMVEPRVNYVGQGGGYADVRCDGIPDSGYRPVGYEGSSEEETNEYVYYQEHAISSTDLYPDLMATVQVKTGGAYGTYNPTVASTPTTNYSSSTANNVSSTTSVVNSNNSISNTDNNTEDKEAEEKKIKQQQKKEFEAKQKENDTRREKEALLNDKTHKHRDDESLTTAGKSHFMIMMMWALIISVVYFMGSKVLYLRNK